ncbi:hypothetical protein T10_532, partial [Trichinella papuae]
MQLRSLVQYFFVLGNPIFLHFLPVLINLSDVVSTLSSNGNESFSIGSIETNSNVNSLKHLLMPDCRNVLMDTKPVAILIYFPFLHSVKSTYENDLQM